MPVSTKVNSHGITRLRDREIYPSALTARQIAIEEFNREYVERRKRLEAELRQGRRQ